MFAVQLVALDVCSDAFHTAAHVAAHKVPRLRKYHMRHHEKTRPVALDTFYNHPVDTALMTLARVVVPLASLVPLLAISWPVVAVFLFWTMFTEMSHHSTHPLARVISLGFIPGRLHPEHHLAHHLHGGCNYGENWVFWDRCMGTLSQFEDVDAPGDHQCAGDSGERESVVEAGADDVACDVCEPV